jgi:opacity protein-like surface antigen
MSFWPDGCQVAAIWQHTLAKFNLQLNYSFLQCNYVPKAVCLLVVPGLGMLGMRRFAIVGAGLLSIVGFASAASAADLPVPVKTPPPIAAGPVPFSWTGCHVGGNVGGAFSYDKIRSSDDFSSAGFIGGGQVGYYDFGDNAFTLVDNINGVSVLGSLKDRIHTVTAGLNYHF